MTGSFDSEAADGSCQTFSLGDFDLEAGGRLRDFRLAYATFGALSAARDNAILVPSFYAGSSRSLEAALVGPGRALDPSNYFIILVNQIGNGLSTSPSNAAPPFNAARFPELRIGDDVRAQRRLMVERFGIDRLALVLGGSMGAQQTYEWAVRWPDAVARAAPIAGLARTTAHNDLLVETFIDAIASDPAFDDGWYADAAAVHPGLRRHARLFAATGFTADLYNNAIWRKLGFSAREDFLVGFVEAHFLPQDPNDLIAMLRKWRSADVARGGDLKAALGGVTAKTTVIAIEEDGFFPPKDIAAEQALLPRSELRTLSSGWGHLALFGVDRLFNLGLDAHLRELLAA